MTNFDLLMMLMMPAAGLVIGGLMLYVVRHQD